MTGLDEVFDEAVITHNSFVGVNEYLHVPEDDQDGNRHLYTCVKASKISPPVISQVIPPSIEVDSSVHGCGYALKGVEDMSRKSDEDWCFRYFQNQVKTNTICTLPLRVNYLTGLNKYKFVHNKPIGEMSASNSQRLHQLFAIVRRTILASVVLDAESVRLVRYDLGLVLPPTYFLNDNYVLSQIAHNYQIKTERKSSHVETTFWFFHF